MAFVLTVLLLHFLLNRLHRLLSIRGEDQEKEETAPVPGHPE